MQRSSESVKQVMQQEIRVKCLWISNLAVSGEMTTNPMDTHYVIFRLRPVESLNCNNGYIRSY